MQNNIQESPNTQLSIELEENCLAIVEILIDYTHD